MDAVGLDCPKILHFINADAESKIEGNFTGSVLRGGYRYQVIDQTIAVKEDSTWRKVYRLFEKIRFFPMCTLGVGLYVKGLSLYSVSALLSLPIAIIGMLVILKEGIDLSVKSSNPDHAFKYVNSHQIAKFRSKTNKSNFIQFIGTTCKKKMANLLTAFTRIETKKLFEKSMDSYRFSDLLNQVGFDLAYKLAPKNKLIKSLNSEFESNISLEKFERNKKTISSLAGTPRLKPFIKLLSA